MVEWNPAIAEVGDRRRIGPTQKLAHKPMQLYPTPAMPVFLDGKDVDRSHWRRGARSAAPGHQERRRYTYIRAVRRTRTASISVGPGSEMPVR